MYEGLDSAIEGDIMTREEILSMSAGRELDELIAEKVMGYVFVSDKGLPQGKIFRNEFNLAIYAIDYSSNILSTWEVVEKFESLSIHKGVLLNGIGKQLQGKGVWDKGYKCEIVVDMPNFKTVCAIGTTAPEAICRAALLATLELPK